MTISMNLFYRFGVALAIGFLIGLQREYAKSGSRKAIFAGERTLALMGVTGFIAAMLADELNSPLTFVAIVGLLGSLIATAHFISAWRGEAGLTTEVASLITVLCGALSYWDYVPMAVAIAVVTAVLLSIKVETDQFVRRITHEDVYATLKFAVITAIVLPVLPNQTFGPPPFNVLNPYNIWLMVVFISGINFLGYVLVQVVGAKRGIGLTGLLGGVASSTAVTLSFTQRSQEEKLLAKPFALAITVAWTVMFGRVLVEVAALNPELVRELWLPMAAAAAAGLVYGLYLYFSQQTDEKREVDFSNPFQLGPAFKFGLLYAFVLLVSKTAQMYLGNTGIYISSVVAGLADADAITLSMAELSQSPTGVDLVIAKRAIVLAAMSNTAAKGSIVLASGSAGLRRALAPGFVMMLLTGLGVAFLL